MTSMLSRLEGCLRPYMYAAGFVQSDQAVLDGLSWIEYRDDSAGRPYVVSIFHTAARGTVTAEAWRPDQLRRALRLGKPERAADRRHTWRYEEGVDEGALDREIIRTVLGWVAGRVQSRN